VGRVYKGILMRSGSRVSLGLLVVLLLAFPGEASAKDYGRWKVTVSGRLQENWNSPATTPCAITGHGRADLRFATARPIKVHLRRTHKVWSIRNPTVLRFKVDAAVSGTAVQQPPPSPDVSCSWPNPATWVCGPLAYSARYGVLAGRSGLALADTHYFEVPPARHEPDGRQCGPAADANLQLMDHVHGAAEPFFRLKPSRVARRHRMKIREHARGPSGSMYDEQPPFKVTATRRRDTKIVLTPIR
jgi:hypothetical protein